MRIDWIQGDKFRDMAHWTYSPRLVPKPRDDYDDLPNTLDVSALKDGDVIYTHMMYVLKLLEIMQYFSKRFVLVSHSCDCSIEDYGIRRPNGKADVHSIYEFQLTDNIIRWYSKNVNTINDRIESTPIGVENARWHTKIPKLDLMREQLKQNRKIENLAFICHSRKTNPKERQPLYDMARGKKWITMNEGMKGYEFVSYIERLYNHKFVFSPEGNGMDTIRTWEALYMGTIPIEKRNLNNRFYTDLPICFVDKWEDVTEEFLNSEYKRIKSIRWNMDKLKFSYWQDKILNTYENFCTNRNK